MIKIINELLEGLSPRAPLGEDRLPLPVVRPGHGGDHGDGPGGALVSSMAGDLLDAGRDVPQARGDGARPSVQGLDLRL